MTIHHATGVTTVCNNNKACYNYNNNNNYYYYYLVLLLGKVLPIKAFINDVDAEPFNSDSLSHFLHKQPNYTLTEQQNNRWTVSE